MISVKAATTVNKLSFSLIQHCWSMIVFNDATKKNPVWQPTLSTMNQQQISFWSLGYYFTCSFSQSTYLFFWCNLYLCSAEIIIFDNWAGWTFVGLLVSNKDCGRKFGERLWAYETVVSGEERLSDGQKMKKAKARRCAGKETQLGLEVYAGEKVGPISRNVILLRCSAITGSHLFKLTDRCHLDCYCCWSICRLRSHFHIFHWHFYQIRNLSVLCVSAWWGGARLWNPTSSFSDVPIRFKTWVHAVMSCMSWFIHRRSKNTDVLWPRIEPSTRQNPIFILSFSWK